MALRINASVSACFFCGYFACTGHDSGYRKLLLSQESEKWVTHAPSFVLARELASVYSPAKINPSIFITAAVMQIMVIAVLIVIAGLVGALLACATSLINRVRAVNTTLRRIEETLLALNRVKAIDSAIKSAKPVKQSQPADAGSAGYLTLRELKTMSGSGGRNADDAPIPNGRKPLRTSVPTGSKTDLQGAIERKGTFAVRGAEVAAHRAVGVALKTEASGEISAAFTRREPSFEISCPSPDQQILRMDLRKDADDVIVHVSHMAVTAEAQKVPTANDELPIQKVSEEVEEAAVAISPAIRELSHEVSTANSDTLRKPDEAPTVESAVGREVPEVGQGGRTVPTSNALDEGCRKKKEQELLMIISSRRRRARAGR